jgi:hypothetical protein
LTEITSRDGVGPFGEDVLSRDLESDLGIADILYNLRSVKEEKGKAKGMALYK